MVTQFEEPSAQGVQTITPALPFFALAHRLRKMYARSYTMRKKNIQA